MSWSAWRTSANRHSPRTSPAVFRDSPPSTHMEEVMTSSKGEHNGVSQRWRPLNSNFSLSLLAVFSVLADTPGFIDKGVELCPPVFLAEMGSSLSHQISGIIGHQPGLQLPLQLRNAMVGCPPGPHQHLSYHWCSTSHCLHAQSNTSSLCGPGHIVRSAGS